MRKGTLRFISVMTSVALLATSMAIPAFAEEQNTETVQATDVEAEDIEIEAEEQTEEVDVSGTEEVTDADETQAVDEAVAAEETAEDGAESEAAVLGTLDIELPEAGVLRPDGTVFYGLKEGPRTEYGNMEGGIDEEATGGEGTAALAYYYSPSESRTRIMDQTHYGTCWTFGALGAVEASVLKNLEGVSKDDLLLSRIHFAYFAYMVDSKDPLKGLDGDSNRIDLRDDPETEDDESSTDFMNEGGLPAQIITNLMNWKGAADGKKYYRYEDATLAYETGLIPHCESLIRKYATKIKAFVLKYGTETGRVVYSSKGYWINMLDPADRMDGMEDADYHDVFIYLVQNYIDSNAKGYIYSITPKPKQSVGWDDIYHVIGTKVVNDSSTPENRAAIKQLISDYGSVTFSYYEGNETNLPASEQNGAFYSKENNSYYCYGDTRSDGSRIYSNHCIQVIGWDDNFSKTKFNKAPEGDGAWIVKNSWMDSEETDEAFCHTGIFYISYYDKLLNGYIAYDVEAADATDNNYQYDGAAYSEEFDSGDSDTIKGANIFTASASKTEQLKRVAFSTSQSEQEVTVSIYKNLIDGTNPESGLLVSETTEYIDYPGFRYVDLKSPVLLNKGEKFAVVVTLTKSGGEASIDLEVDGGEAQATTKAGRSFLYEDGAWVDVKSKELDGTGDVRIKAYTDNVGTDNVPSIQNPDDTVALYDVYKSGKIKSRIVNADEIGTEAGAVITVNAGTSFTIKSTSGESLSDFQIIYDSLGAETIKSNKRKSASGQVSKSGLVKTKAVKKNGRYSMMLSFKQGEVVKSIVVNVENIGFDPELKRSIYTEYGDSGEVRVNLKQMTEASGYSGEATSLETIKWTVKAGRLATVRLEDDGQTLVVVPNASAKGKVRIQAVVNGKKYSTFVKLKTGNISGF